MQILISIKRRVEASERDTVPLPATSLPSRKCITDAQTLYGCLWKVNVRKIKKDLQTIKKTGYVALVILSVLGKSTISKINFCGC
jgi:hypothetical protein